MRTADLHGRLNLRAGDVRTVRCNHIFRLKKQGPVAYATGPIGLIKKVKITNEELFSRWCHLRSILV